MKIGKFDVGYLSHVSFVFRSPKGTSILTDPLFVRNYIWNGHNECYLSPPNISVNDIAKCDAVFVSHIHGDHFDPEAVKTIHNNTRAKILAPDDVLDSLRELGVKPEYLVHIENGVEVKIGDLSMIPLAGYDNSFDDKGRPNKFATMIMTGDTRLFYSGDCHETPPGLKGKEVDAIFSWTHTSEKNLVNFCKNLKFSKFVLMHGDKFEPGDFLCNLDYSEEKRKVERLVPGVEVIIPERMEKWPA